VDFVFKVKLYSEVKTGRKNMELNDVSLIFWLVEVRAFMSTLTPGIYLLLIE